MGSTFGFSSVHNRPYSRLVWEPDMNIPMQYDLKISSWLTIRLPSWPTAELIIPDMYKLFTVPVVLT